MLLPLVIGSLAGDGTGADVQRRCCGAVGPLLAVRASLTEHGLPPRIKIPECPSPICRKRLANKHAGGNPRWSPIPLGWISLLAVGSESRSESPWSFRRSWQQFSVNESGMDAR